MQVKSVCNARRKDFLIFQTFNKLILRCIQLFSNFQTKMNPSKECLKRISNDLKDVSARNLEECGIFVERDEVNALKCHVLIVGPVDTPYEGGLFFFSIKFPVDYPMSSPSAKIRTTGGGTVRFNPNLYSNGKVCLSILGTWTGPSWTSALTLSTVLLSIQSLMGERPMQNEPGHETCSSADSEKYNEIIIHETMRVAIADNVELMLHASATLPPWMTPTLCEKALRVHTRNADKCARACLGRVARFDGKKMNNPFGDHEAG